MITFWVLMLFLAVLGIVYGLGGYVVLLKAAALFVPKRASYPGFEEDSLPGVTVYLSAFNEVDLIERRLENLLELDYPSDRVEIIVVSDGSTDGTDEAVRAFAAENPSRTIELISFPENRGRAEAQNVVGREASHEILVATDADSLFLPETLRALVQPFSDPGVGVVGGRLVYRPDASAIAESVGTYRGVEYNLRAAEERVGVLAKTDGPCTAYRRSVWKTIEQFEDVDHVAVIFARKLGMEARQALDAVVIDTANSNVRQEIRARGRMTRKGLLSIHNRWTFSDIVSDPAFSFALYSHRHARFLIPFFVMAGLVSCLGLLVARHVLGEGLLVVTGLVGVLVAAAVADVPLLGRTARSVMSFLAATLGFASGWIGWLSGDRSGRYRPSRQLR
jgi:GT2 family glycosyltransferase